MSPEKRVIYPTPKGVIAGISALPEKIDGGNLTDKLGLAGVLLLFPELIRYKQGLILIIALSHQVDHYFDSAKQHSQDQVSRHQSSLTNFNTLYPDLLKHYYDENPELVKNLLGFINQAMIVEKHIRGSEEKGIIDPIDYRETQNAIWVRMILSGGYNLYNGSTDSTGSEHFNTYEEIEGAYREYIKGNKKDKLPGNERSYLLFLWTMFIQEKFDAMSVRRNRLNGNPCIDKPEGIYLSKLLNAGVNRRFVGLTSSAVDLLPYLQRYQ
jgi:hypothetical protein